MEIENEFSDNEGIFYIARENQRLAKLYYRLQGSDRMVIEHTEVSPLLKGNGIGKQLVDRAVAFAREKRLKIVPMCAFARSVFERFKEYEDVL